MLACGGTTSTPPVDASTDQGSQGDAAGSDASTTQDSGAGDSSSGDGSTGFEAGSLDQCNPNVANSCPLGKKCCSEPTHQTPPSAYVCVSPTSNGGCPALP